MRAGRRRDPIRRVWIALLLAVLAGCSAGGPEAELADYRIRVGRALDGVTPSPSQPQPLTAYPRPRDRRVAVAEPRLSVWDLLQLLDCELARSITRRNGAMGRVLPDSQRLLLELDMLDAASRCVPAITDAQLRLRLTEAFGARRGALPDRFWNAVPGGEEMAGFQSADVAPLALAPAGEPDLRFARLVDRWLSQLAWLQARANEPVAAPLGDRPAGLADAADFEADLAALRATRIGGATRRTVGLLDGTLAAVATAIDAPERICPQQRPTPRARILRNVFQRSYAGVVQPGMARITRTAQRLEAQFGRLLAATDAPAPAVVDWYDAQWRRPLASLRRSTDRHTRAWQQLFEVCGLSPFET